jgi:NAD(P)-dependent dehydrogenase (short-subunit alcohol dehydrogenase family)
MDSIRGKIALITGGGRGIGREISLQLAKAGCDIAINYHARKDDAEKTAAEVHALGRRAITVQADVANSADVKRLVAEVEAQLGPINILVNNAGRISIQRSNR